MSQMDGIQTMVSFLFYPDEEIMGLEIYRVTWEVPEDAFNKGEVFKEKFYEKEEDASAWCDELQKSFDNLEIDWDSKITTKSVRVY